MSFSLHQTMKYMTRPAASSKDLSKRDINLQNLKNKVYQILDEEKKDFDQTKFFENEKYTVNKTNLQKQYEKRHGRSIAIETIDKALDDYPKANEIKILKTGQSSSTQLSPKDSKYFNNSYKTKSLAQMASELTGGQKYTSKEFKAKYAQLMRRRDTLVKEGILNKSDFMRGQTDIVPEKRITKGAGFKQYREAQQRLMDLDPKNFKKYSSPEVLDYELRKLINFNELTNATRTLPDDFLASYEHFQGITPSHIIQDPSGLRKVGLTGRKYNWQLMGRTGKYSPYNTVKTYLRTAKEAIKQGDNKGAQDALKKVNLTYDEIQKDLPTIKRNELPKYTIKGKDIVESNLKGVMKPQTLQKSFDQYFRNIASYATDENINQIRKTQPNVAEALTLYQQGDVKEAKQLIKSRLPDVRRGQLFAEVVPGSTALSNIVSDFTKDIAAKRFGTAALKGLGIAGVGYGIYDVGVGFTEGKSAPELATRFIGLDPVYNKVREYARLSPESKDIQKRVNAQNSLEASQYDAMDEGLVSMMPVKEVTEEEKQILAEEKEKVQNEINAENEARRESRSIITDAFQGRVGLAEGGPPDPMRRKVIKGILGLAAALPFLGKMIKPVSKAAPEVVEAVSRTADQMPTYLTKLIEKIKMMGSSKILGKFDTPDEYIRYDLGDYELHEGVGGARLKRVKDRGEFGYEEFEMQIKKDPETGYIEYEEVSARPDYDGKMKDIEFGIDDDIHAEMKKFADED